MIQKKYHFYLFYLFTAFTKSKVDRVSMLKIALELHTYSFRQYQNIGNVKVTAPSVRGEER